MPPTCHVCAAAQHGNGTLCHLHTTDALVAFLDDGFKRRVDGARDNSSVGAAIFGHKAAANKLPRNGGALDEVIIALFLGRLGDIAKLRENLFGDSQINWVGRIVGRGSGTGGGSKFLRCQLGLVVPSEKFLVLFGRHGRPNLDEKVVLR